MKAVPEIHQAIIRNDLAALDALCRSSPELLRQKDCWGFRPIELAHLLGRRECLSILSPGPETPIQILPQGEKRVLSCSEKQFEELTGVQYTSTLLFDSYDSLVDIIGHCPWYLQYSSLGRECRWLGTFYRNEILHGTVADVTIRWIDEELGYGLFTNQPLQAADFVVEYTGLVRQRWFFSETTEYCFRYPSRFWSFRSFVVDARKQGNYARFLNHSDDPNCIPACAVSKGLTHILFRAKRFIPAGSQLTIDYGRAYWRTRKKPIRIDTDRG